MKQSKILTLAVGWLGEDQGKARGREDPPEEGQESSRSAEPEIGQRPCDGEKGSGSIHGI